MKHVLSLNFPRLEAVDRTNLNARRSLLEVVCQWSRSRGTHGRYLPSNLSAGETLRSLSCAGLGPRRYYFEIRSRISVSGVLRGEINAFDKCS